MTITLVNPMNETARNAAAPAPRVTSLQGKTIALLDISKPGGSVFLDRIEQLLKQRHGVAQVIREMKPTFAKPAPAGVLEKIRGADAVIEALAD
jgi:hypothetical protein